MGPRTVSSSRPTRGAHASAMTQPTRSTWKARFREWSPILLCALCSQVLTPTAGPVDYAISTCWPTALRWSRIRQGYGTRPSKRFSVIPTLPNSRASQWSGCPITMPRMPFMLRFRVKRPTAWSGCGRRSPASELITHLGQRAPYPCGKLRPIQSGGRGQTRRTASLSTLANCASCRRLALYPLLCHRRTHSGQIVLQP